MFLNEIINKRIKEIEAQGYVEITYQYISPIQEAQHIVTIDINRTLDEMILEHYIFYAKYVTVEQNNNIYYFKTQQDADNFLTEIKKYDKNNYTNNIKRKTLNSETSQETLNNVINEKKIAYEKQLEAERKRKEEAARRAAAAKKAKQQAAAKVTNSAIYTSNSAVVNYALQFVGNPYVHGGTSLTNGADCSGFVQSVYKHFGINLPRNVASQANVGKYVSINNIQPGDLVFYSGNGGKSITHVAIYVGNNKIIHARTPAKGIGVTPLTGGMVLMTIRRVL
jgi:cell wall-associated NlpC family hydrolase